MPDERRVKSETDKITLKVGIIASFVSAFVLFIMTALWSHESAITRLDTNQQAVMKHMVGYETIPAQLARIQTLLEINTADHIAIMTRLDRR